MVYTRVWQLGFEQQGGKRSGGRWAYLGGHSSPLKGRPAKGERVERLHGNTCSPPDLPGVSLGFRDGDTAFPSPRGDGVLDSAPFLGGVGLRREGALCRSSLRGAGRAPSDA